MRTIAVLCLVSIACAGTPPSTSSDEGAMSKPVEPPPEITAELVSTETIADGHSPVGRGELPWWHELEPGIYRFEGELIVLGVGDSKDHHHIAEGFLAAKVKARLFVRKICERIGFKGPMPEPDLFDLFITREQRFFALYRLDVPHDAAVTSPAPPLEVPAEARAAGMHRRGRHVFEGDRHLFLECDVEGPIANPDWGRSRASARY
jgi:hypothetical protein